MPCLAQGENLIHSIIIVVKGDFCHQSEARVKAGMAIDSGGIE